jgi:hypothetical protein
MVVPRRGFDTVTLWNDRLDPPSDKTQRFPYPQAYGSETAATPRHVRLRQERATEAYRPEASLRQSALLRVPL